MDVKMFFKKNALATGDEIKISKDDQEFTGRILPLTSKTENLLKIKLRSGYNIGVNVGKIKSVQKIISHAEKTNKEEKAVKYNPALPTIAILHTGGTIASRVNYTTGGVIASFAPEDLLRMFPEINEIANIKSIFVANIMSEDMQYTDYQKISKAVAEQVKNGIKGIIVAQGTDMLSYSAAALAFELENCPLPILFVGSQRSSDRGSADAAMNLICAAKFIAKTNFKGVAVCMHNSISDDFCAIMPATKVRKMHTSRRDAFKAINENPIALVDYVGSEIIWIKEKEKYEAVEGEFKLHNKFEDKVGILKMHPFVTPKDLQIYKKKYKGLIIEGTGLGHIPIRKGDSFIHELKKLVNSGCIVGITSQCINGRTHPTVYTNLRKVYSTGAIYCEDMLAETALIKLSWLLGNFGEKKAKELLAKNLRGEISEFSEYYKETI